MAQVLSAEEQQILADIQKRINLDALTHQLATITATRDPVGYMEGNINWEIDTALLEASDSSLDFLDASVHAPGGMKYQNWNPYGKFLGWVKRHPSAALVSQALCHNSPDIHQLLQKKADLKEVVGRGLLALVAKHGKGFITPSNITMMVGILGVMVLHGVEVVCESAGKKSD
jgi:hypothetical protein